MAQGLVSMVQLSLIKLHRYREWTHTLGEDREHRLQVYQANFYKIIQEVFSKRGGLVLPGRGDEFFAITDGITIEEHQKIQYALTLSFPVDAKMFVSSDRSPMKANEEIFRMCKTSEFGLKVIGKDQDSDEPVHIIHADIEGQTGLALDATPFDMLNLMLRVHQKLTQFFLERNSLAFYMGGDNFVIISDHNAKNYAKELVEFIRQNFGLGINCGIGKAKTARKAMELATTSLDSIRRYRTIGKNQVNVIETQSINDKLKVTAHITNQAREIEFLQ